VCRVGFDVHQHARPESGHDCHVQADGQRRLPVPQGHEYEAKVMDVLKRAVAEALERKRKLGQYAVVWREGRVVCTGPDAPGAPEVPSTGNPR
jgi:hypothetical protein